LETIDARMSPGMSEIALGARTRSALMPKNMPTAVCMYFFFAEMLICARISLAPLSRL